jgi:hypothetical protein
MKRLIVISVVFALIAAGTAFAMDVGGTVIGTVDVASASGGEDAGLFASGATGRARLEGSGDADIGIGTVGGWLRYDLSRGDFNGWAPKQDGDGPFFGIWGKAWWQPIEQLRIQLGTNPDGEFDTSHIGRYGFYAFANEIPGLVNEDGNWGPVSFDAAVFGGYGTDAFSLIITPTEALSINVAIPIGEEATADDTQPTVAFKNALFQANYAADFGAIHVTYQGLGGGTGGNGKIFGSVFLGSLVEGLGLELGLSYTLVEEGDGALGVGLGASFDSGAFGIKLRTILVAPGNDADLQVRVDLLPSFAVNDNVAILADAGILMAVEDNFVWHFAPYVRIGSTWGPQFLAGIQFNNAAPDADYNKILKSDDINWSIPIGVIISF